MSALNQLFVGSQCLRCLQRATTGIGRAVVSSVRQQVRGKKKLAKSLSVKVRLLSDIPRYGRQGAIIPVAAGRMRNELYPRRLAEYVTASELRELGLLDTVFERDPTFGISQAAASTHKTNETKAPLSKDHLPKPEHGARVVPNLPPSNVGFHQNPNSTTRPESRSPSIPETTAISASTEVLS